MKHTIKFANWLSKWNDLHGILGICLLTSLFVIIFVFILSLKRKKLIQSPSALKNYFLRRKKLDDEPHHNWLHSDLFTKPTFCNVCENGMMVSGGLCCTYCNLYVDVNCLKNGEKKFKCKKLINTKKVFSNETSSSKTSNESTLLLFNKWAHHWIKGNLKLNSVCSICQEDDVGSEPGLNGFKCAWCWRTAHEKCINCVSTPNLVDECDFGNFGRILLKPNLIFYDTQALIKSNNGPLSLTNFCIQTSQVSLLHNWTPLIVFANPKSGNNDADIIVKNLTTLLNPLQIVEMNKNSLESTLKWAETYSDLVQFKFLVCGGDGSIGWLLESLSKFKFKKYEPAIGILPLGTGNDLSRALKWGAGYVGDEEIEDLLSYVDHANYIKLDRWEIKIDKNEKSKSLKKYMNNYVSVGCDALVTLQFHRERNESYFANRLLNKFIYFKYGTIDTFLKECRNLTQNVQLELDGKKIELPHLESIVVLNIPFWGGGCEPWTNKSRDDIPKSSINDGLLEVFGVYSSFHIAQLQVGLADPYRIGQAREVKIKLLKRFPMQVDGEPFEQNPATITITKFNQALMLEKQPQIDSDANLD